MWPLPLTHAMTSPIHYFLTSQRSFHKKLGPWNNWQVPMWQMANNVPHCQQLPRNQAEVKNMQRFYSADYGMWLINTHYNKQRRRRRWRWRRRRWHWVNLSWRRRRHWVNLSFANTEVLDFCLSVCLSLYLIYRSIIHFNSYFSADRTWVSHYRFSSINMFSKKMLEPFKINDTSFFMSHVSSHHLINSVEALNKTQHWCQPVIWTHPWLSLC